MKHAVLTNIFKSLNAALSSHRGKKPIRLLLAVSGGADSTAMLMAVNELKKRLGCEISVITVNHNIRPEAESAGDAEFVCSCCAGLGIPCTVTVLAEGEVLNTALCRKKGVEEAARFLRYRAFKKEAKLCGASYILTAHNRSDYFETVLMRLFQGADGTALTGIAERRDMFLRPMLGLERNEIEEYLRLKNICWREDASNSSQEYLRNKIRSTLVPALSAVFGGWEKGLFQTVEKIKAENAFVLSQYKKKKAAWSVQRSEKNGLIKAVTDFKAFTEMEEVFKILFLKEGFNLLSAMERVPHSVFKNLAAVSEKRPAVFSGGFSFQKESSSLFLFKGMEENADTIPERFYSVWIEKEGRVATPAGIFDVTKTDAGFFLYHPAGGKEGLGPFKPPFCIRSRLPGDTFFRQELGKKAVKKLINEWGLDYEKRNILPIIEEKGLICGIFGSALGKKNWYAMSDRRKK